MLLLSQIALPAILDNLQKLIDSVSHCLRGQGFESEKIIEIEITLEEALLNIINYAYRDRIGDVKVSCRVDDESRFIIEIEDTGPPFDVLSVNQPDLSDNISERKVGGLGIHLIRNLMSDVQYVRKDDKNILLLIP
jgi:anti-sigma regulatory factor (Ser/Thr protein kinase)